MAMVEVFPNLTQTQIVWSFIVENIMFMHLQGEVKKQKGQLSIKS